MTVWVVAAMEGYESTGFYPVVNAVYDSEEKAKKATEKGGKYQYDDYYKMELQ
jgi:hypothetical protein